MVNADLRLQSFTGSGDRRARSYLLVRASAEGDFDSALDSGADALILDLGDWANDGERARRREAARRFLAAARETSLRPALFVCVAPVESEAVDADLQALMPAEPDGVFLSQACGGTSVQHLAAKLAVQEAECGLADGATRIVASAAQTPAAIFRLETYAGASRRLAGLAFDPEALGRSLAAPAAALELTAPFALARSLTLFGASAAGVAAIDAPCGENVGEQELHLRCRAARRDGFAAKLAVVASQIPQINKTFATDPATL